MTDLVIYKKGNTPSVTTMSAPSDTAIIKHLADLDVIARSQITFLIIINFTDENIRAKLANLGFDLILLAEGILVSTFKTGAGPKGMITTESPYGHVNNIE